MILAACAVALGACRAPDYVETEVYTQRGDGKFARPVSSFEEETYGLAFTTGWLLGANHAAVVNLARLDVNKAGELMMHDLHDQGETVVNVEQKQEQDAASEAGSDAASGPDSAAAAGPLSWLPAPPRTLKEAYPWLAWIVGVSFLLWVLAKTGLADRIISRSRRKGGA